MGAAGRKLTIRMPDNPGLRSAEVGKVHLDPGARVQSGNPVLTLVNRRKEHLVRSPRSGRIVPLIAPGDRVNGGDPLYILHIDEAALEEKNREERVMIAVEREKWTSGVLADAIEPLRRDKFMAESGLASETPAFVANWGKPVLALALYVLACFALLPILHLFGKAASTPVLIAMFLGCVAFAALIFYLYAPDAGRWPRWTVRMVAISWVGISSAALFYRPDDPADITLDNAIGPVASLFTADEKPLAPPPEAAPAPVTIVLSGVAVGPTDARSRPTLSEPATVLASFDGQIRPHGVQVRDWGRVNPRNDSGDVLLFDPLDQQIVPPEVAQPVLLGSTDAAEPVVTVPELPEELARAPQKAERQADIIMAAIPQVQDSQLPETSLTDTLATLDGVVQSDAVFTDRVGAESTFLEAVAAEASVETTAAYGAAQTMVADALPVLRGQQIDTVSAGLQLAAIADFSVRLSGTAEPKAVSTQPDQVRTPALNLASSLRVGDADWAENQLAALERVQPAVSDIQHQSEPVPSILRVASQTTTGAAPNPVTVLPVAAQSSGEIRVSDSAPGTPQIVTSDFALDLASRTVGTRAQPGRVATARSPGLMLIGAVQAGESGWMLDQTEILADARTQPAIENGLIGATQMTVVLANLTSFEIGGVPKISRLNGEIGIAKDFAMAVLPVLDGEPDAPATLTDAPVDLRVSRLAALDVRQVPSAIGDTTSPGVAPQAPPLQPELKLAQRDLLYLYFDDPRILSHPQLADPWQGLMSPELSSAIQRTEVVEVHEMLQVQNWCAAANDPDGSKRAELGAQYTTAFINDRIRLLRVRLSVDEARLALLESEIPLFDGTPAGFFHNKAPLLAGLPEDALMQRGRDYLRSLSAGIFDPNAPDAIGGGQYFDNAIAVSVILQGAGCNQASLNEGAGPTNEIGRVLSTRLGG